MQCGAAGCCQQGAVTARGYVGSSSSGSTRAAAAATGGPGQAWPAAARGNAQHSSRPSHAMRRQRTQAGRRHHVDTRAAAAAAAAASGLARGGGPCQRMATTRRRRHPRRGCCRRRSSRRSGRSCACHTWAWRLPQSWWRSAWVGAGRGGRGPGRSRAAHTLHACLAAARPMAHHPTLHLPLPLARLCAHALPHRQSTLCKASWASRAWPSHSFSRMTWGWSQQRCGG